MHSASRTLHRLNCCVNFFLDLLFHNELFICMNYDMQICDRLSSTVDTGSALTLLNITLDLGEPVGDNAANVFFHTRETEYSVTTLGHLSDIH